MKKFILIFLILSCIILYSNDYTPIKKASLSLLLPGYGLKDYSNNVYKGFMCSEVFIASISIFNYFKSTNDNNNAINLASLNFNKDISQYPEELLTRMAFYENSDEYNVLLPSKARDLYPDDVDKQLEYINENTIPDSLSWQWSDTLSLNNYYYMRKSSRLFKQFFTISLSTLIINHIASSIFTYFKVNNIIKSNIYYTAFYNKNNYYINVKLDF